ncbi:DUF2207 domain-containing protein [Phytohabitans sp. ZYX-F-186]|uniref:DUF2207 domain-containing protein n=1 Tax=Phytohabitans maris TaxID=3071409 RepID=A0ABU0ZGM5_9ACTN|nr:DUF2207 domain-containing protein [Phytohabitans sp. ZYX-F-186]MDQ7906175.1 DUF2207 domain-containing protein [Phytohabitans sp. ZYX-F-186]
MAAGPVARRRRRDAAALLVGVLLVGLAGLLAAGLGGSGERIPRMWVAARLLDDGSAQVTEVIDYDFAGARRHGIYRTVPQDAPGDVTGVAVTMDGAPVPFDVRAGRFARIVIGDPAATVTGVHRYRIDYGLPRLGDDRWLAWDAVGTDWEVPVDRVEVHVAGPHGIGSPTCVAGWSRAGDPCAALAQPVPGQLDAVHDGLDAGQGLTLYGQIARPGGGGAALPPPPGGPPPPAARGDGIVTGWLWATGAALAAALVVAALLRLAGRERVRTEDGRIRRMDIGRLARTVRPSPLPPAGLGPAQGGILLTDQVRKRHLVAWLLGAGLDRHLRVTGISQPVLRLPKERPDGADELTTEVLATLFAQNPNVALRKYNRNFAAAWTKLRRGLRGWRRSGGDGLWERRGEPLRRAALVCGALATAAGLAVLLLAAGDVTAPGAGWRTPVTVGAALAGAGLAALLLAWELRTLTVRGSDLWCRTEAYRRHLAGLDAWDGRDEDVHTAWAVALGEARSWLAAAQRAVKPPSGRPATTPAYDHVRWQLALYLPTATASATSSPAVGSGSSTSSGGYSGGGSSGGVGGGDGGGGGGSW